MIRREVRVAPHHRRRLPAPKLLQDMQRGPVLHVPRGPGVPQIVPAEVLDSGALQRLVPSLRADLPYRLAFAGEDTYKMVALLPLKHFHRSFVERDGDGPPGLGLVGMHPGLLPFHIDLIPAKARYVGSPEPRR